MRFVVRADVDFVNGLGAAVYHQICSRGVKRARFGMHIDFAIDSGNFRLVDVFVLLVFGFVGGLDVTVVFVGAEAI